MNLAAAVPPSCEIALDFERPVIGRWTPKAQDRDSVRDAFDRLDPVGIYEILLVRRDSLPAPTATTWLEGILETHQGLEASFVVDNAAVGSYERRFHVAAFRGRPRDLSHFLEDLGPSPDHVALIDPTLAGHAEIEPVGIVLAASTDVRHLILNLCHSNHAHLVARNQCFHEMRSPRPAIVRAEYAASDVEASEVEYFRGTGEAMNLETTIRYFPRWVPTRVREDRGPALIAVNGVDRATALFLLGEFPQFRLVGLDGAR